MFYSRKRHPSNSLIGGSAELITRGANDRMNGVGRRVLFNVYHTYLPPPGCTLTGRGIQRIKSPYALTS